MSELSNAGPGIVLKKEELVLRMRKRFGACAHPHRPSSGIAS